MIIHEGETLADIKPRIQKKLQVPDEEFAKVTYCHVDMYNSCKTYCMDYEYDFLLFLYVF